MPGDVHERTYRRIALRNELHQRTIRKIVGQPRSEPETGQDANGESAPTPRWVKVFGAAALVLILAFVVLHLTVGGLGGHGG